MESIEGCNGEGARLVGCIGDSSWLVINAKVEGGVEVGKRQDGLLITVVTGLR